MEPPSPTLEKVPPFTSGEVPLVSDASASQLSKPPKEITEATPRVQSQSFLNWAVRADITSLHQGTYKSRPATLLILTVHFLFPSAVGAARRLSEARIIFTFRPSHQSQRSQPYPIIRAVIPKLLEGPTTATSTVLTSSIATAVSVETPAALATGPRANLSASHTRRVEFARDELLTIRGTRWPSKEVVDLDLDIDNTARWELAENSALGRGVPAEFRCGVIVEHGGQDVEGTVKIAAQTKMGLSLFGWPWSESRPVVIKPGMSYGEGVDGVNDFAAIRDDQWDTLCSFDGDVVVRPPIMLTLHSRDGKYPVLLTVQKCKWT